MKSVCLVLCASFWMGAMVQLQSCANVLPVEAFVQSPRTRSLSPPLPQTNHYKERRNRNQVFIRSKSSTSTEGNPVQETIINPSSTKTNTTLNFPPFGELMDLRPGEFVASEAFTCCAPIVTGDDDDDDDDSSSSSRRQHQFRVKLYPRGGGGDENGSVLRSKPQEFFGLYLEYLGSPSPSTGDQDLDSSVPVTFALRLKGRQAQKRFDVEWRAGMCFVADREKVNLKQGFATEFGAPLMQTGLLPEVLGITNQEQVYNDARPVLVEAEVFVHDTDLEESVSEESSSSLVAPGSVSSSWNRDIRLRTDGKPNAHDTESVRVGKVVVPVLSRLSQRPKMFEQGAYPGVEYRILRILDREGRDRFTSCPGADYELKPVYPLVAQLERQWPVRVNESDIPKLFTPSMYNLLSAAGSLFTAVTGLFTAFLLSQAISLFFIPSKSMDPTLQVGDVLLVDKLSSRTPFHKNKVGDMILFSPPSKLQDIVARNGGNLNSRDLFVKRIAASPGDRVAVFKDGKVEVNDQDVVTGRRDLCEAEPLRLIEKYIEPSNDQIIDSKEVFVMGDCSSVSVDSRVWGPLDAGNIVGRPIIRLWPLDRFGKVE